MKGYFSSYVSLFDDHEDGRPPIDRMRIPLFQRDFAQGRPDAASREIRTQFLEALLTAVAGGDPIGLDFIYGKIANTVFYPLDGQQRLTTLLLLHWYWRLRQRPVGASPKVEGTSRTRPATERSISSAGHFEDTLPRRGCPIQPSGSPISRGTSTMVVGDPTIQSMLTVIARSCICSVAIGIDRYAALMVAAQRSTSSRCVSFYCYLLGDVMIGDDLYIKMNSRGKPLTAFETFKALFERVRRSSRAGIRP